MASNAAWLASVGAWTVFAAVALLLFVLAHIAFHSSEGDRTAVRFYVTAPVFLLVGVVMAVSLLLGWPAPGGRLGVLEAHVHANVWGFLAFIVAGTLTDLLTRLVRRPLAHPGWQGTAYWALLIGVAGLIAGPWLNLHGMTLGGLAVYTAGTALLVANLVLTAASAPQALSPRVAHLLLGYVWMIVPVFFAPFIMLAPEMVPVAQVEDAALQGLILGWVLQMAMGGMPAVLLGRSADDHNVGAGKADGWGWFSVALVNLGVAVSWAARLLPPELAGLSGVGFGMALVALGALPFVLRMWWGVARQPGVTG